MEDLEIEAVEEQPTDDYFLQVIETVKESALSNQEQQEKLDKLIDLMVEEKEQAALQAEEEAKAKEDAEALAAAEQEGQAEADAEMGELEAEYKDTVLSQMQAMAESEADTAAELIARLETIIEHQETIIDQQLQPTMADNMANIYGMAIIPGLIILFGLWRGLIKPFVV